MFKHSWLMIAVALLAACGSVREIEALSPQVAGTSSQTVFFATQRDFGQVGAIFGEQRKDTLRFGELDVSIPPNHEPGKIEWESETPDPTREFAITRLDQVEDLDRFAARVFAAQVARPLETMVFIHGYNTTAPEAIFRLAQIQEDLELRDPAVLFTWPSAARARGYVYDRDSVLFARDDLVAVLDALTRGDNRVVVAAHSMGAQLTMEVLRQARITGNDRLIDRIAGVILMSPDIDLDVFRRQAAAIEPLPQPFVVLAAEQDRALGISSFLTGRPRLGATIDARAIDRPDVAILDLSEFATGDNFDHMVAVTSQTALDLVRSLIDKRLGGDPSFDEFLRDPRAAGSSR